MCKREVMIRRYAVAVFAIACIVTLGVAIMYAHMLKAPDALRISTPCGPASPGFRAVAGSETVAMKDWSVAFGNAEAPANFVRKSSVETFAGTVLAATPGAFPPLLNRPPPTNS